MKTRKLLASLIALVLLLSCMSVPAFAAEKNVTGGTGNQTWEAGSYTVSGEVTINGTVTINGAVTLNIADGAILTITAADGTTPASDGDGGNGGAGILIQNGASLTVAGSGTLNVTGGKGGYGKGDYGHGGNGGDGINIVANASLSLNGGTVNAKSGSHGVAGSIDLDDGRSGASVFCAGAVTVAGGTLTANTDGEYAIDSVGTAFTVNSGTVTANNSGYFAKAFDGLLTVNGGEVNLVSQFGYGYCDDTATKALTVTGGSLMVTGNFTPAIFNMSGGKLKVSGSSYFPSDAAKRNITGGFFSMDVTNSVATGYKCVSNSDSTYTYKVVPGTSIAFTPATTTPVFEAGVANTGAAIGELSASNFSGTVTYTATVYDAKTDGNVVETSKIYAGIATDKKSLLVATTKDVTEGTYYVAVSASDGTNSATLTDRIEVKVFPASTGSIDLDLESDTETILDSKSIDQLYIKTEKKVEYYVVSIDLYWNDTPLEIKVADAKKWNPKTLSWDVDNGTGGKHGVASMEETTVTKTMILVNSSANAFNCTLEFTENESLSNDLKGAMTVTITDDNATNPGLLDKVEVDEKGKALAKYFNGTSVNKNALPQLTFTAKITVDTTKFNNAAVTTSDVSYGTFKLECTHIDEAN